MRLKSAGRGPGCPAPGGEGGGEWGHLHRSCIGPNTGLTTTTIGSEKAGIAKLVVVITCKRHGSANLSASKVEKRIGCRRRPAARLIFNLANGRTASTGLLFVCVAGLKNEFTPY
jgi:hypothetical protein